MTLANRWLMLLLLLITLSEAASSSQFPFNYGLTLKENKPALLKGDDNSVIFEVYQIDNLSTPDRSDLLITASLTSNGGDVADNRVRGTYTTSKSNRYSIEGLGKGYITISIPLSDIGDQNNPLIVNLTFIQATRSTSFAGQLTTILRIGEPNTPGLTPQATFNVTSAVNITLPKGFVSVPGGIVKNSTPSNTPYHRKN